MTRCDVCTLPAVMLVRSNNGMGGDPTYGAFKSNRCEDHGRDAVDQQQRAGYRVTVDRFAKAPDLTNTETAAIAEHQDDVEREQQILVEDALAESKVLLEATPGTKNSGFFAMVNRLRERSRCATCGKATIVVNVARRGFRAEKITPATHCLCEGSPLRQSGVLDALSPLELAGSGRES